MSNECAYPSRDKAATMQTALVGVVSVCAIATASAQERPAELASGPSRDFVENHCSSRHSLDYLTMKFAILDDKGWTSEVNKMIVAFGAPIEPADTRIIVDYLVKNYGTGATSARLKAVERWPLKPTRGDADGAIALLFGRAAF